MKQNFKILIMMKLRGLSTEIEKIELERLNFEATLISAVPASEKELIQIAGDVDVILGGGSLFTRPVLESLPKCQAVITYSVGFDGIDIEAATDNGILVLNNPASEWCIEEVSNHAIGMLIACAKKLFLLNDSVKQGDFPENRPLLLDQLQPVHEQILGLVGFGAIAQMVAKKAKCFGLKIVGYDPYLPESFFKENDAESASLPELLKKSDFVSIHSPLNKETWHLIGEKELRQMKSNAFLINTGRGGIVDESALIKALEEKWIAGAGLDVFENERLISQGNPLFQIKNVFITPHSAAFSTTALDTQPVNPIRQAVRLLKGEWPNGVVNHEVKPKKKLVKNTDY